MGTGMRGWKQESNQPRLGQAKFTALVRSAMERGVKLFDLADLYGSHSFFANATAGVDRDDYTIITKIWLRPKGLLDDARPDADVSVERFLKELKTDRLDVVLLHCQTAPDWPKHMRKQMDLLAKMKDQGKIRAHGISCHSIAALAAAVNEPWVDSVNTRTNAFGVKMDGPPDKVAPVLRQLHDAGKGLVGMKLCGEGQFRDAPDKRQQSVRWALNQAKVDAMIVGFESTAEIDDFAAGYKKATGA